MADALISLQGKRVVVTGAAGVLGRGVAARASELGADVMLVDVRKPEASSAAQRSLIVDLTDRSATLRVLRTVPVDVLFCVAGGFDMGPAVHEVTAEQFSHMMTLNVATFQNAVSAVVPGMIERGRGAIVSIGALSAMRGQPRMGAYTASKSVVMRLSESLSAELKDHGINVNCVLPSIIDTPANRQAMPEEDFRRWVQPRDLANVLCFLGSDAARAIHGALIPIAGRV
jgi:NAD(P)-dependent dehydrogenase (short-subunit alcohol dehydrogenase family)